MPSTTQWSKLGSASLAALLALPSPGQAHGMGLDEMAPPVVTAVLLGLACYWLIVLWPAGRNSKLPVLEPTGQADDAIRIKQKPRLRVVERRLVND